MRRLALVALVAVACGAAPVQAQTLALAYKSGDTYKYALHSTVNQTMDASTMAVPVKIDVTAGETVTINSVDSSGTADVSIALTKVVIKSTTGLVNNTTSGMELPAITMKIASDGRVVSTAVSGIVPDLISPFSGGYGFITAILPDAAVKPGDSWSKEFDQANRLGTGAIHVTAKSTYLRDESVRGVNAAVVETKSTRSIDITIDMSKVIPKGVTDPSGSPQPTIPPGMFPSLSMKGTITSDTTSWVDPASHRVLKTHRTAITNTTMTYGGSSDPTVPGLTWPITIKGDETIDQNPA